MTTRKRVQLKKNPKKNQIESNNMTYLPNNHCCQAQVVVRQDRTMTLLSSKMTTTTTTPDPTTTTHCKSRSRTMQSCCHHHHHHHHRRRDANTCKSLATSCFMFLVLIIMPIMSCTSYALQHSPIELAGQQFTCGKLYYRTFHMDQQRNVLYVGAM